MRVCMNNSMFEDLLSEAVAKKIAYFTRTQILFFDIFQIIDIQTLHKLHRQNFLVAEFFVDFRDLYLRVIFKDLPHQCPVFLLNCEV